MYTHRGIELPEHLKESLDAYVNEGRPTGDFLKACVENNLLEACGWADEENLGTLAAIVGYLYNECPAGCWGFKGASQKWIEQHGRHTRPVSQ